MEHNPGPVPKYAEWLKTEGPSFVINVKIFSLNVRSIVGQNSNLKLLKDDKGKTQVLALQKHFTKHVYETFLSQLALGIDFTATENEQIVLMGEYNIDFQEEQKTKIRNAFLFCTS